MIEFRVAFEISFNGDMKQTISIGDSSGVLKYFLILGALLLGGYQLLIAPISPFFSIFLLTFTLIFFGLPHGALDHRVEQVSANANNWSLSDFLKNYFLKILITCVIWLLSPSAGFIGFILFSAYHFGETDLRSPEFGLTLNSIIITLYGLGVMGCLLIAHMEDVWGILSFLSPVFAANNAFTSTITNLSFFLWSSCFFIICLVSAYCFIKSKALLAIKIRLFIPALLLLILYPLPTLAAFSFYFGLWHSLHALAHIRQHLNCSTLELVKIAIPFSVVSIFGLAIMLVAIYVKNWSPVLITIIFISALTTPHAGVMTRMYDNS